MENNMKTYKVEGATWSKEITLDPNQFPDKGVYMEAATRAVEWAMDSVENFNLGYIVSIQDVADPDEGNIVMITSYLVLINAGHHDLAESMRQFILESDGIDVKPKKS